MPNWCGNSLSIEGDSNELKRFRDAITTVDEKGAFTYAILTSLYPVPQELTDTVSGWSADEAEQAEREKQYAENLAKYGHKDWYDWQYEMWGTKWGDCDTEITAEGDTWLSISFNTAWGPAIAGFEQVSKLFPTLTFVLAYEEMGMGFVGATGFRNGLICDHSSEDIHVPERGLSDDDDDLWDRMTDAYYEERDKCEDLVRHELSRLARIS